MGYGTFMPNTNGYGYGNQYFAQPMQQPMQPMQMQNVQQPQMQPMQRMSELQGKAVESLDVVKAIEIPLDGSISYFPLADGTAIITKKLQMDGTSKITIYKPVTEQEETVEKLQYVTVEDFNKKIKEVDVSSFKDEIKNMKRQIEDLTEDVKDINKDMKKRKD